MSAKPAPDLNAALPTKLREELRNLIGRSDSGLIIDARDHLNAAGLIESRANAAFRLCDGSLRRHFITIWGLFKHPSIMDQCLVALANVVITLIKERGPIDWIVTCTATGNHLMGHIRARLEYNGVRIPGIHMGPYPLATEIHLSQLKGKRVIFITDVIDQANLTKDALGKLIEYEAEPVAILAVVVTKESDDYLVRSHIQIKDIKSVPLFSLTDFTLAPLDKSEADPEHIINVDAGMLLSRVISDRQNGMLLGPEVSKDSRGNLSYNPNTVFQLPSGIFQRHFITLWPLFEKIWYFDHCMDQFAAKAKELRLSRDTYYSGIVTCTATGRHLMEHLQARIETEDRPVEAIYLGPYPYQAMTRYGPREFENKPVLVLADVIASTRLVTDIASVVHKLGGKVAAVLGVVALRRGEGVEINKDITYAPGATAQIHYLVSFAIERSQQNDFEEARKIKIDAETVLPQEPDSNGEQRFQLFDHNTALHHFDRAEAIRMGQFAGTTRHFTAGISLPRLFDACGAEIWQQSAPLFDSQDFLVTATDREDLQFLYFIQQWVSISQPELKPLFIPRSDSIDFDFPYFLPREDRIRLSGKRVVLLISSVQISEKLRKLVSLLAQSGVVNICVVCLINRMGHHTSNFIGRIEKMSSGVGTNQSQGHFSFKAIYPVNDLSGTELTTTVDSIHRLAAQYAERTGSTLFRSLVEEEMRYFRMRSFLGGHVSQQSPHRLADPMRMTSSGMETTLHTWDAMVYALYSEAQKSRRYEALIALIPHETDRSRLYLIFVLLLADVAFLRLTHQDEVLKTVVLDSIRSRRFTRIAIEDHLKAEEEHSPDVLEGAYNEIFRLVQEETYLLFGLALFSYLDADSNGHLPWIWQTAMGGFSALSEWNDYPLNFQVYYGEPRSLWCVSLLLRFSHIEESFTFQQFHAEAGKLRQLCTDCLSLLPSLNIREVAKDKPEEWHRRLKYSFDSLLTDLGFHELRYKHQVLRFLRSRVSHRAAHHNAIIKDIRESVDILQSFLHEQPDSLPPSKGVVLAPPEEEARRWKVALDKAIQAAAFLDMIGSAASELFGFYPAKDVDEAKRFLASPRSEGFQHDVHTLQRRLSRIRAEATVSWRDISRIDEVLMRIAKDLDDPHSALRTAVQYYHQPLLATVLAEMESADKYLSRDYWDVWKEVSKKIRTKAAKQSRDPYVLCDPLLLREVLWNLFTNVRHGLPLGQPFRRKQYKKQITVTILIPESIANPGEELQFCEVVVTSPPGSPERSKEQDSTMARHSFELKQFHGQLVPEKTDTVFRVTLKLLYRQDGSGEIR